MGAKAVEQATSSEARAAALREFSREDREEKAEKIDAGKVVLPSWRRMGKGMLSAGVEPVSAALQAAAQVRQTEREFEDDLARMGAPSTSKSQFMTTFGLPTMGRIRSKRGKLSRAKYLNKLAEKNVIETRTDAAGEIVREPQTSKQKESGIESAPYEDLTSSMLPVSKHERFFMGRADDPEFAEAEKNVLSPVLQKKYGDYVKQAVARQEELAGDNVYFTEENRKAFLKAADDGGLLKMFDTDDDEKLSKEERSLFFHKDQGFLAGGPKKAEDAAEAAEAAAEAAAAEAAREPLTGKTLAQAMRVSFEQLQNDPEALRASMSGLRQSAIDAGIADADKFNRVGRKMWADFKNQQEVVDTVDPRSPEASDWVKTPGLDDLAAMQKREFGTSTALRGEVGGLRDAPRSLGTEAGRLRRRARELERFGYRKEAGEARGAAAASREPRLQTRADREAVRARDAERRRKEAIKNSQEVSLKNNFDEIIPLAQQ